MNTRLSLAVILAAGRGLRLGEKGELKPKGFITLGEKPIIEESILKLKRNGFTEIVIITGHCHNDYELLAKNYPHLIRLVYNQHFKDSGSMYSLYLAKNIINGRPFLLLESDLIYEERAIIEVCQQPHVNVMLVSGFTGSGDEVYVSARKNILTGLSKQRGELGAPPVGELVGITKLSGAVFKHMIEESEKIFVSTLAVEYENILSAISAYSSIHCHLLQDLLWCEIDNETHLVRARNEVYPRLRNIYKKDPA